MNDLQVLELAGRMAATWPNYRPPATKADSRALVSEWREYLGDLDASVVTAALRAYATEGHEWPPAVGVLRRRAVLAAAPTGAPDVGEAWGEIRRAFSTHGYVRIPRWTHPAIEDSVRSMGGWVHMCETWTSETEVADRAHFQKFYANIAARHVRDATPPMDRAVLDACRDIGELERPDDD